MGHVGLVLRFLPAQTVEQVRPLGFGPPHWGQALTIGCDVATDALPWVLESTPDFLHPFGSCWRLLSSSVLLMSGVGVEGPKSLSGWMAKRLSFWEGSDSGR
jgi:hypothetical protein